MLAAGLGQPTLVANGELARVEEVKPRYTVARVLSPERLVRIPGTSLSIGFDPLVGLIPGIGDALANLIGTVILGIAARLRLPRIVLSRMSLNLLINGTVGAVPVIGDLFSVWFQSHARNATLLREAALKPDRETRPDWLYVGGLVGGTVLLMLLLIAGVVWLAGSVGLRSSWQYVQVANCADTWIVLAVPKLPAGRDAKDIGPVPPPCTCRSPGPWQASHPTTGRGTFPV